MILSWIRLAYPRFREDLMSAIASMEADNSTARAGYRHLKNIEFLCEWYIPVVRRCFLVGWQFSLSYSVQWELECELRLFIDSHFIPININWNHFLFSFLTSSWLTTVCAWKPAWTKVKPFSGWRSACWGSFCPQVKASTLAVSSVICWSNHISSETDTLFGNCFGLTPTVSMRRQVKSL